MYHLHVGCHFIKGKQTDGNTFHEVHEPLLAQILIK